MNVKVKQLLEWEEVIKECRNNIAIVERQKKRLYLEMTTEEKREYEAICKPIRIEGKYL